MFTLNIKNIVVIGKGNIKWMADAQANTPEMTKKSLQAQITDLGKSSKDSMDFIVQRKVLLDLASDEELKKLSVLAQKGKAGKTSKYNEELVRQIQVILDTRAIEKQKSTQITATNLIIAAPQAAPAVAAIQEEFIEGKERTTENTTNSANKHMSAVEKTIAYKDNEPLDLQYEQDGKMKSDSVAALFADLDGMSGVERTNRGWFSRVFSGGGEQKEIVGEQQLNQMLRGKTQAELNALYSRITGDTTGIDISRKDLKSLTDRGGYQNNRFDFDHKTQSKITKFQTALIQQVDVVATMSSILLGDTDARTGLATVLEGKTDKLQAALRDENQMKAFKETLTKSGVLNREPAFLEKAASVLLRIGISAGFSVFSGGVMGAYVEQSKLEYKNGKATRDGLNMTVKKSLGDSGSVAASLDLAAIRLEANWNDPEMRISNRVAFVMEAKNTMQASQELVTKITDTSKEGVLSEKQQIINDKIGDLGKAYLESQKVLTTLPDTPARKDVIGSNTLTYLAKVEALQGARLKGLFASATLSGLMAGLSGSAVDTSASFDKVKVGVASIEAEVLGKKPISQEQVQNYLTELGITESHGTYTQYGKEILIVPAGQKVQWSIEEIYTDRDRILKAVHTLVPEKTELKSEFIALKRSNVKAENTYIDSHQKEVAKLAKDLRATSKNMTDLQETISKEGYGEAISKLQTILKGSKNTTAVGLLDELPKLDTKDKKKAFFDLFLGKTSGSDESRKMGADLEAGKDIKDQLTKYYKRLAKPFAREYLLQESQVTDIFNKIQSTLNKDNISTLGDKFKDGFTGLVAFNQINAGKHFVKIDKVDHTNARIVGKPVEITDIIAINTIKDMAKKEITPQDIQKFKEGNIALQNMSDSDIKDKMVEGKVSAYLSFEKESECFNLGFVVEPGKIDQKTGGQDIPVQSNVRTGTLVGKSQADIASFGVGTGLVWKKESPRTTEEQPVAGSKPGTGGDHPIIKPPSQANE